MFGGKIAHFTNIQKFTGCKERMAGL